MVKSKKLDSPFVSSVQRRNERERKRVHQVNEGFASLRERLPDAMANRKMSKVETLRSAIDYIVQLQSVLVLQRQHRQPKYDWRLQRLQRSPASSAMVELHCPPRRDLEDSLEQTKSPEYPSRENVDDSEDNGFSGRIVPWCSSSEVDDEVPEHHRGLDSSFEEFSVPFTI